MDNKQITKIVITGGPCAGKTTAMKHIGDTFSGMGFKVLFIAETATELITGGIAPWVMGSNYDFQCCQMQLQIAKEQVFEQAAQKIPDCDKILIVCDRGIMDNRAYMTEADFEKTKKQLCLTHEGINKSYGAVFHLVTAAKGAEEFYTLSNNSARTETIQEAAAMDDKLISVWKDHPYHRIIDNSGTFDDKIQRLIEEIRTFLKI